MNYRKSYICKLLLTAVLMVTAATAQGASDAYSVPDVAIKAGEQASFKISLTNQSMYTSATIDLQLPKGISIPKVLNEDGEWVYAAECPAKKSDHNLTVSLINAATNTYRFLVYSASNKTFRSGSVLFTVTVEADKDMVDGVYKAKLIASDRYDPLVEPDGTQSFLEDVEFRISVTSTIYKLSIQTLGKGSVRYGDATVRDYSQFTIQKGNDVELVFVPDNGYELSQATVNGKDIKGKVVDGRYAIQNVKSKFKKHVMK